MRLELDGREESIILLVSEKREQELDYMLCVAWHSVERHLQTLMESSGSLFRILQRCSSRDFTAQHNQGSIPLVFSSGIDCDML